MVDFPIERPLSATKVDLLSHIPSYFFQCMRSTSCIPPNLLQCTRTTSRISPNLLQCTRTTRVGNPMILTELMPKGIHREIITKAEDLASRLSRLHFQPILHRDISSANVLLELSSASRCHVKISDFGSQLIVPGNVTYMAPETLFPHLSSRENVMDVYTFGITHLEIATLPFILECCITHGEGSGDDETYSSHKGKFIYLI